MTYYPYAVLFHHILGTILAIFSFKFSTTVIFYRKFISANFAKLSPVLLYYFIFTVIWSVTILINKIYSIAFWRPEENVYNAFVLYWTGFFPQIFAFIGTTLEIFLCLDRCATILFPLKYSTNRQKYYSFLTLAGLVIFITAFLFLNNLFEFIPATSSSSCIIFGCFLQYMTNWYISRFLMVFLNIFCGCILFFLVKIKFNNSNGERSKQLNRAVLIIIATTSFSEVFPFAITHYFGHFHNIRLNDIIGPFAPTFASINITISSWLYSKAFRETFKIQASFHDVKIGAAT